MANLKINNTLQQEVNNKSFIENNITQNKGIAAGESLTIDGKTYKINYDIVEKKTKRKQIVLQPSLLEKANKKASELNLSFNAYIELLIQNDITN